MRKFRLFFILMFSLSLAGCGASNGNVMHQE